MEELMASALEIIGKKGFVAATVAEITEEAGYAKGTFYRFWSGKDEMLLQLIEQKLKDYRSTRDERLKEAESLEEVLTLVWDFLDSIMEDRNWARVFLEFTVHASRTQSLRRELRKDRYRFSNKIFSELLKDHVWPGYPLEKMGSLNTALFEGFLVHKVLGMDTLGPEDMRRAAITLALSIKEEPLVNNQPQE